MKYANIIYSNRNERITIGDDIQLLAIENLYREMGINYDDVIRIEFGKLATYDGEPVILPVSFPFISYTHDAYITMFSDKIRPVFLGLCILTDTLSEEEVAYLKRNEPVGCRDEYTRQHLAKYGIKAYLGGCMTLTFPFADVDRSQGKIFCVDIPEPLREEIPKSIRENGLCEFTSHTYYVKDLTCTPEEQARNVYQRYRDEARLVITTRMHAALPCVAAGIPVVLLKDRFSWRFMGIDKIVPVYTKETYSMIDWNPKPIHYEKIKELMLEVAQKRVLGLTADQEIQELDNLLGGGKEHRTDYYVEFVDNTIDYINRCFQPLISKKGKVNYVLWGITQTAEMIYHYISTHYSENAKLIGVIDRVKKIMFCGVRSCQKEEIEFDETTVFLVCTAAAIPESNMFFQRHGIEKFYQCCGDSVVHERDAG